jgi:hypothetical protein
MKIAIGEEMQSSVRLFEFFDTEKLKNKYAIDSALSSLKTIRREEACAVLRNYRYFTHHYISDMANLIGKMPFSHLRSLLAEFLHEELGEGNPQNAHPQLYDDFLLALGCSTEELSIRDPWICEPLDEITERLKNSDWLVGMGLRGLGGECLCQIYLETAHSL